MRPNPKPLTKKPDPRTVEARRILRHAIQYPKGTEQRATKKGYPAEVVYDQFAYERLVDSYRDVLRAILKVLTAR